MEKTDALNRPGFVMASKTAMTTPMRIIVVSELSGIWLEKYVRRTGMSRVTSTLVREKVRHYGQRESQALGSERKSSTGVREKFRHYGQRESQALGSERSLGTGVSEKVRHWGHKESQALGSES